MLVHVSFDAHQVVRVDIGRDAHVDEALEIHRAVALEHLPCLRFEDEVAWLGAHAA